MTIARVLPFCCLTPLKFAILFAISGLISLDRKIGIRDLAQDYVSARSWVEGTTAYQPLPELHERFCLPPPMKRRTFASIRIHPARYC